MQSDRELLELAAKAAGLTSHRYYEAWKAMAPCSEQGNNYSDPSWNPLTDDGDALRLAVALDIHIGPNPGNGAALAYNRAHLAEGPHNVDKQAATRRAIVRAAAEIGATMQGNNHAN